MNIIGVWSVSSMYQFTEEGMTMVDPETYLNAPIASDDEEYIAHEMKERKGMVNTELEFAEDGTVYITWPIPEGASKEEIDKAISVGAISMRGDRILIESHAWEEREDGIYYDTGIKGEIFGEKADSWTKIKEEDGIIEMMFVRYKKK